MFNLLFKRRSSPNRTIRDALYAEIVAAARQPAFYSRWGVDDTPLGRFEMLSLHMILFMERVKDERGALAELAQELTDDFFLDVDHSLRELGISDMGVPKRMKKLARMFYGRADAYSAALREGDAATLAAALARNVSPGSSGWNGGDALAAYAIACHSALARTSSEDILAGRLSFPMAGGEQA